VKRPTRPSALRPEPFRPGRALPLSIALHLAVFAALWAFAARDGGPRRLIDPDDVVEVSMVSLPEPQTRQPQKEMRARPPRPRPAARPVPREVAAPDLEPVPETPPPDEPDPERETRRDDLMREMQREALLESLRDAPEGPVDQSATTDDGGEDPGSGDQSIGDAELARYSEQVREVFYRGFSPLQDDPGLTAVAWVWVDPTGRILEHEVHRSSDNGSFDAAVTRAIRLVDRVPAPPDSLMTGGRLRLDLEFSTDDR